VKIVFSGLPALHHLLPFAPLAHAAAALGHRVALLTDPGPGIRSTPELAAVRVLPAGPSWPAAGAGPALEDAIDAVWTWRPDVIVSGVTDAVGPVVAATLDVPHAVLAWSPPLPAGFVAARAAEEYAQRGLAPPAPVAVIDLCPPALRAPGFVAPPHHLPMRPEAPRRARSYFDLPRPDPGRPAVLVALAGVPDDVLVRTVRTLDPERLDVRVGVRSVAEAGVVGDVDPRVRVLVDAPRDDLVDGVDVVVGTGEAGALLGALAHGRPMVLLPQGADQPWHAARAAAAGTALVAGAPDEVGPAVARVLGDPSFRAAARAVQAEIAGMPAPAAVVTALRALLPAPTGASPVRADRNRVRRPQHV
jgi:UDP:flavonoid glycosyltransferase YjiC (YdhE family)